MENSVFRKSSLERLSSPEELNQYIKATKPMAWLLLIALSVIVLGMCTWGIIGIIPETVTINGVVFTETEDLYIYAYLPLSTAKRLEAGMDVQVSPDYAKREEYGFIYGTVESIGNDPVSRQELVKQYGDISYVEGLIPQGNVVEVKISLVKDRGWLLWSNAKGKEVTLEKGAYCTALVVTKEQHPIDLLGGR